MPSPSKFSQHFINLNSAVDFLIVDDIMCYSRDDNELEVETVTQANVKDDTDADKVLSKGPNNRWSHQHLKKSNKVSPSLHDVTK